MVTKCFCILRLLGKCFFPYQREQKFGVFFNQGLVRLVGFEKLYPVRNGLDLHHWYEHITLMHIEA